MAEIQAILDLAVTICAQEERINGSTDPNKPNWQPMDSGYALAAAFSRSVQDEAHARSVIREYVSYYEAPSNHIDAEGSWVTFAMCLIVNPQFQRLVENRTPNYKELFRRRVKARYEEQRQLH